MKITIDIEPKEIAELRTSALPIEILIDSKFTDVKNQILDEIVIDIEPKEIAELRTLPIEILTDSKFTDVKNQILDEIVSTISKSLKHTITGDKNDE